MATLLEFRSLYPFKPYDRAYLRGHNDQVMKEIEIISYPWEDTNIGGASIKIRTVPGDPDTLAETNCSNLIKVPKKVRCIKHVEAFEPTVRTASAHSRTKGAKTLEITCPKCGRGYFLTTELVFQEICSFERQAVIGQWLSDRPLEIVE